MDQMNGRCKKRIYRFSNTIDKGCVKTVPYDRNQKYQDLNNYQYTCIPCIL